MNKLGPLLGIERPIIQAPMAGVQDGRLAVAVSNAGALGSLPCAMLDANALRAALQDLRVHTERPVNVNFFCHAAPTADPARPAAWADALAPYARELGVELPSDPAAAARTPFDAAMAEVLEAFRPAVVSFHFGLPAPELLARVRGCGAKILSSATTLEEALWLQERGVDAVIAQGLEAGGHRGHFLSDDLSRQLGTFALVPQLVAALKVPVIAAGGIADAHAVRAALALGAAGVQAGTAYLLCAEAKTSALHRAALRSPAAAHTALTNVFTGRAARSIVNRVVREVGPLSDIAPPFPLAAAAMAKLRAAAEARGSSDFSPLWAGQNASGCAEVGAAELTRRLAAGL